MQHLNQVKTKKLSKFPNILGVILARGNSKGIKNKNLLRLNNKTLIDIAISTSLKIKRINKLVFSSDSQKLINEAKKKLKVYFKRPKSLATDKTSSFSVAKHAVKWIEKNQKWKPDIVVILSPTTPFRKARDIDATIDLLIKNKVNSAITVTNPSYPPHWMFKKKKGKCKFLFSIGSKIQRRLDTPKVYQPAGMVYVIKKNFLFKMKGILPKANTATLFINKNRAINIDDKDDYMLAKINEKKINF